MHPDSLNLGCYGSATFNLELNIFKQAGPSSSWGTIEKIWWPTTLINYRHLSYKTLCFKGMRDIKTNRFPRAKSSFLNVYTAYLSLFLKFHFRFG